MSVLSVYLSLSPTYNVYNGHKYGTLIFKLVSYSWHAYSCFCDGGNHTQNLLSANISLNHAPGSNEIVVSLMLSLTFGICFNFVLLVLCVKLSSLGNTFSY